MYVAFRNFVFLLLNLRIKETLPRRMEREEKGENKMGLEKITPMHKVGADGVWIHLEPRSVPSVGIRHLL